MALRHFRECDLFRKLPPEHREADVPEPPLVSAVRIAGLVVVAMLTLSETGTFLSPKAKQRFDVDMGESATMTEPRKIRVLLNITVHDFPCIDLSLDYQDVMGTRATDVKTTVFKQRLHADGSLVGELEQNDPKTALGGGPSNPTIHRNVTGNKTCGHCYGALPEGECCNTCSDVLYAYRLKRWALPRIEDIEQCKNDGKSKLAYQPPQIIRLDEYSSDDYLPKFSKMGSLGSAGSEAKLTAPFRLNFTLEPLKLNLSYLGKPFNTNFSKLGKGTTVWDEDLGDDYDDGADLDEGGKEKKVKPWPDCVRRNVIVHGYDAGEALMVDLRPQGAKDGCWQNDCSKTDQFNCEKMDTCAAACHQVSECRWWTWGTEDGATKCWIRSSKHTKGKRYGFSSGASGCYPSNNSSQTSGDQKDVPAGAPPRRLSSLSDDDSFLRPRAFSFGSSLHMPMFGLPSIQLQQDKRREQKGESCRIHGYFDTNKVPGNFHIGTHGSNAPSYITYFDEPVAPQKNMRHTINSLGFVEVSSGQLLTPKQPLDGFESPKAFTFQYYLTVTPATMSKRRKDVSGYQFRAGSFVTNELIGPAVFFRLDIDPIRVTYYTEEVRWSRFLVSICAVVGGCLAVVSMLGQFLESAVALAHDKD